MEGLATAAAAAAAHGATTLAPPPGLTFTYTPADIQGLAEPRSGGGGIQVAAQPHHHGHSAMQGQQRLPQQVQGSSPRLHVGNTSLLSGGGAPRTITSMPVAHTVNPYDTIEALIQQQERSHSQSQSPAAASMRLPSTPDSPVKEQRPRIRGRMTPYAFFVQQRREFYRQQGVPVQFTPFSKECSALWKTMTEEEKQKFQKLAEDDRERYKREVSGFDKPLAKDGTRRGRRKKEPGQPKRNMCAFLHFCSVKRPKLKQENPSLSVGAMARQLSSAWKLMTPEQKTPYNEMASRDKQRYEQQKQAYEAGYTAAFLRKDSPSSVQQGGASGSGQGASGVGVVPHNTVMIARHRRRKKDPDMPRRNMSAFMFYSLEHRPEVKGLNPDFGVGKLAQRLAEHWKVMDSTQKHPYDLMARKDKERYEQELKAYKKGVFSGTGQTPRQVAHSVTGRTIPPPVTTNHRRSSSQSVIAAATSPVVSTGLDLVGEVTNESVLETPSGDEGSPPLSGDELDQLCEFYN